MVKQEFLAQLRQGLAGLPPKELEERLSFYAEMVDDRMEEGLSEENAVRAMGDAEELIAQIAADVPLAKLVKEKIRPKRRLRAWEITLLAVGSPIWVTLLLAVAAVILSLFVSLWAVIVSLWAVPVSLGGTAVGCLVGGVRFALGEHLLSGLATIGAGVACAGLTIFAVYGCKAATVGAARLMKKTIWGIKTCFARKGEA